MTRREYYLWARSHWSYAGETAFNCWLYAGWMNRLQKKLSWYEFNI